MDADILISKYIKSESPFISLWIIFKIYLLKKFDVLILYAMIKANKQV